MKLIDFSVSQLRNEQSDSDFRKNDVEDLKEFVLGFQAATDEIVILNSLCELEFNGDFIFTLMEKSNVI